MGSSIYVIADFLADNACLLFFANGLAFFAMGLAITLELRVASTFTLSQSIPFLAGYGFVASVGNWIQMSYLGMGTSTSLAITPFGQGLKLACFILSGILLLQFGVHLMTAHDARYRRLQVAFWVLLVGYAAVVVSLLPMADHLDAGWASLAEASARYMLHAPGLALSGLALFTQRHSFRQMGSLVPARDAVGATVAFGLKLVVSGLVGIPVLEHAASTLPGGVVTLQLLRTLTTVAIAVFMVRILRVFEMERRQQLDLAVAERLRAQDEALRVQQQMCAEIEAWSSSMAHTVHSISSAISQPIALDETMQIVLRQTVDLAGLESGAVFLLDEEEQVLRLVAHEGLPDWVTSHLGEVKMGAGLAGWVAQAGEPLVLDDTQKDPRPFVPGSTQIVRSYAGVPLLAGGKVLGVMSLSSREPQNLSPQQAALLAAAGQQLGVAIEDARLHRKLRSVAAMEERLRLSRELHDSLVQIIGYLYLKSGIVRDLISSNRVSESLSELADMEEVSALAYEDVRDSIAALRVRMSADEDLVSTLRDHVADLRARTGIEITLDAPEAGGPFFAPDTAIQVLRIIQEALTNVRRHAQATSARVTFELADRDARIVIQDDGRGFDPARMAANEAKHLGMVAMRERTESVGGELVVDSKVGGGTRIELSVPLDLESGW